MSSKLYGFYRPHRRVQYTGELDPVTGEATRRRR